MKMKPTKKRVALGLWAAALLSLSSIPSMQAATALQAQLLPRPVTPGDVSRYKLPPATEVSGGLTTIGIGQPFYLEAEVNIAIPATDILSVTWAVTNQPLLSVAAPAPSPLGTNVPVYEPADRLVYQVAGRTLLRPDLEGQYTVIATITTASEGTTNVSITLNAAKYMGIYTCFLCHGGGSIAPDKSSWTNTAHSTIFTKGIDGNLGLGAYYSQSCLQCHTVGYDSNTNVADGGFYNTMQQVGWTFPTVITNGNWANLQANYPSLANLGNIQCENCHGPGSQHASALGNTNVFNWPRLSVTVNSGDCNQCHDAPTHHVKGTEWYVSKHAGVDAAARVPSGPSRGQCVGCHTSSGFIGRMNGSTTTNTTYSAIACQTCHEPHGQTVPDNNPHLLRILGSVTMPDGTVVTNAGNGALCLQCHHNRNGSVTNMLVNYPQGLPTWYGGSSFGTHDGPQGDMIEGINAVTYGQNIPSSAHRSTVPDLCVGCHMQTVNVGDPAFLLAGGHTFEMSYNVVTNGITNTVAKTDACAQCHGPITTFNFPVADYDGDGVIDGVQTEIQHLLDKLSTLLPNAKGIVDGTVKSSLTFKTNWTQQQLEAGYNWQFVNNDGSLGVHNAPFAAGLLKASIGDLTGDSNSDGLPDAWQIQYFGSANNPLAAPNADPAGDGVPNWVKYSLGLDPNVPGIAITNGLSVGVVWANGKNIVNPPMAPGLTNTIAIFTAAEIYFDTEAGKTYQIQGISSLSGGWQNIGDPIVGTGSQMSYVTPTRQNTQMFFRVEHN
jgi:hypothetical protein